MLLASDFIARREAVFAKIGKQAAKVLVYGRNQLYRTPSVAYPSPQFSDMIYLTGHTRPGGALAIERSGSSISSTMFLPHRIAEHERWNGARDSYEESKQRSGVDRVLPITELEDWLVHRVCRDEDVYASFPPQQRPHSGGFSSLTPFIDAVRWLKTDKERGMIKKACEITQGAFGQLRAVAGMTEGQIAARFKEAVMERGGTGLAYPTVAATGSNALCLHHVNGNDVIRKGDSVLVDAGCEFNCYASDFTRTLMTDDVSMIRKELLLAVDNAKNVLVGKAKKGEIINLWHLQYECEGLLYRILRSFRVNVAPQEVMRYFPHDVTHWIGLDVHDCDAVPHDAKIEPGCVFAVEPGLYFPVDDLDVPSELRGLGCRFEDTVIVE